MWAAESDGGEHYMGILNSAKRPRIVQIIGGYTPSKKELTFNQILVQVFENGTSLFLQVQNRQCFQSNFDQKILPNQEPLSIASSIPQESGNVPQ